MKKVYSQVCVTFTDSAVICLAVCIVCLSHWQPRGSPGGRGDSDVEKDRVGVFIDDLVHLRREKVPGIVLSIAAHKHLEMEKIGEGCQTCA